MIEQLDIPIEYVPTDRREKVEGLLLTVDCQYGASNVTGIEADHVAVIDHHPLEIQDLEQYRVQSNMGSCTTLVWCMLKEENYPVSEDINIGTALYYGLYTDTNQFAELFNPLDMDMRDDVTVNMRLVKQFRNSNLSLRELEIAGIAMIRCHYNTDYHFAVIKAQPCDPNILGLISDFLLQVAEIKTCVVYNEIDDGFKISVRSCINEVNANELAVFLTDGIGSGGGHYEKAGGFISMKLYEKKYPMLHSESYFNMRMTEYFDSFTIILAKELKLDLTQMKQYARRKEPLCIFKVADIVKPGVNLSIRTRKGSFDCVAEKGICFAIERDGIVHPITEERVQKYFSPIDGKVTNEYYECAEYAPTVKDWTDDLVYRLVDYAGLYLPKEKFQIYAKPLDTSVKLFPEWDEDKYMLGMPGDYLAVCIDDLSNAFIEPGDNFLRRFE